MRLDTPRLLIRDLGAADLDSLHRILDLDLRMDDLQRDDRARWLQWTVLDYEQRRRLHQPPYGDYAVELRSTGETIGLVGFVPSLMPFGLVGYYAEHSPVDAHAYSFPEVGLFWAIASAHQRRGYAAEAAAAMLAFGFDELGLRRVVATTEHANAASIGVMRRLGMRIERNPGPAPFFLQVVGIMDNPHGAPSWPTHP